MTDLGLNLLVLRILWNIYVEYHDNLTLLLVLLNNFHPIRAHLCQHTANAPSAANNEGHCQS